MGIRLTDDEIVYAAVSRKHAWPHPLPTVAMESDSLLLAGARGARSLEVRDLAKPQADSAHVLDDSIVFVVDLIGASSHRVIAYVADPGQPALLAGRSFSLSIAADDPGLVALDFVSAKGIHDLHNLSLADGREQFLVAVEEVYNSGFDGRVEPEDAVLILSSTVGDQVLVVGKGRVVRGLLNTAGDAGSFDEEDSFEGWDAAAILETLGLG